MNRLLLVALLSLPMVARPDCGADLPIGSIENADIAAPPKIVSADGTRILATSQSWLCPRYVAFEISGATRVVFRSARGTETIFDSGKLKIDFDRQSSIRPGDFAVVTSVFGRLGPNCLPIAPFDQARSPNQVQPPLKADPLLPTGPQRLPLEFPKVAVLWQGGPCIVTMQATDSAVVTTSSGRRAFALVELPRATRMRLGLLGQDLSWPVVRDLPSDRLATDVDERVARAVQTLRAGPADERLYALSKLALLAAHGHFAAEELLAAARSNELAKALGLP